MSHFIKIIIFIFVACIGANNVSAEDNIKVCQHGFDVCGRYIKDKPRYKQCLSDNCGAYYKNKTATIQQQAKKLSPLEKIDRVKMCEYGEKRCLSLSQMSYPAYWECIVDSCSDEKYDTPINLECSNGKTQCQEKLEKYENCARIFCPRHPKTGKPICNNLYDRCQEHIDSYWSCIYRECLEPVDVFLKIKSDRKALIVENYGKAGLPTLIDYKNPKIMNSAYGGISSVPSQTIDPIEYRSAKPSQYKVVNNPQDIASCPAAGDSLTCMTSDVRSCYCRSGKKPIFKKLTPKRYDFSIQRGE